MNTSVVYQLVCKSNTEFVKVKGCHELITVPSERLEIGKKYPATRILKPESNERLLYNAVFRCALDNFKQRDTVVFTTGSFKHMFLYGNACDRAGVLNLLLEENNFDTLTFQRVRKNQILVSSRLPTYRETPDGHLVISLTKNSKKLTIVDLDDSDTKSRLVLGNVIVAMRERRKHIPFRSSKLTFVLEPSLSSASHAFVFAGLSVNKYLAKQSLSTLQFCTSILSKSDFDEKEQVNESKGADFDQVGCIAGSNQAKARLIHKLKAENQGQAESIRGLMLENEALSNELKSTQTGMQKLTRAVEECESRLTSASKLERDESIGNLNILKLENMLLKHVLKTQKAEMEILKRGQQGVFAISKNSYNASHSRSNDDSIQNDFHLLVLGNMLLRKHSDFQNREIQLSKKKLGDTRREEIVEINALKGEISRLEFNTQQERSILSAKLHAIKLENVVQKKALEYQDTQIQASKKQIAMTRRTHETQINVFQDETKKLRAKSTQLRDDLKNRLHEMALRNMLLKKLSDFQKRQLQIYKARNEDTVRIEQMQVNALKTEISLQRAQNKSHQEKIIQELHSLALRNVILQKLSDYQKREARLSQKQGADVQLAQGIKINSLKQELSSLREHCEYQQDTTGQKIRTLTLQNVVLKKLSDYHNREAQFSQKQAVDVQFAQETKMDALKQENKRLCELYECNRDATNQKLRAVALQNVILQKFSVYQRRQAQSSKEQMVKNRRASALDVDALKGEIESLRANHKRCQDTLTEKLQKTSLEKTILQKFSGFQQHQKLLSKLKDADVSSGQDNQINDSDNVSTSLEMGAETKQEVFKEHRNTVCPEAATLQGPSSNQHRAAFGNTSLLRWLLFHPSGQTAYSKECFVNFDEEDLHL